jgi:hypothetical protein
MALHDWHLYGIPRKKFYARQKLLTQTLQQSIRETKSVPCLKPQSEFQQKQFNFLSQQLLHATHEEFGMTVLQSLYVDILDRESDIGKCFAQVLNKDFPI